MIGSSRAGISPGLITAAKPSAVRLFNFPNPFNAETVVAVSLPAAAEIEIEVYNVLGQSVRRLFVGYRPAGVQRMIWDGHDKAGRAVASGLYLVSARVGQERHLARMLLVR